MSIKNDRWSALSLKDRADLMNMYITNGISDLKEMKKHYNSFAPGGPIETDEYGYPADITPAVVTQDSEFNKFLMTLPDNQRLTPEEDYHTYQYWKINGKPKDFSEALSLGMYHYDSSDSNYHANSVAFDNKGVGYFMKPKHHPTVKYELDWYNKGIGTLEGGKQYPLQGEERKEWEDFRSQYQLDSTGVDYKYVPKKHYNSFDDGGRILDGTETEQTLSGVGINTLVPLESREDYLNKQRQSTIDASLEKSYSRTDPDVPKRLKYANETSWREILEAKINYNKNLIRAYTPEDLIYESNVLEKQRLLDENALLTKELSGGYKEEYIDGASCIYTATGNYGDAHKCSWNVWFRENPEKYGFTEINLKDVKPGDIIQDFTNLDGIPHHALTFIGYDDSGKARYNYSSGGNDSKAIKKQAYYPYELDYGQFTHFTKDNAEDLQSAIAAYRFVGNEEENLKWNNDYNQYRKDYSSKVLEELKDVPVLPKDFIKTDKKEKLLTKRK